MNRTRKIWRVLLKIEDVLLYLLGWFFIGLIYLSAWTTGAEVDPKVKLTVASRKRYLLVCYWIAKPKLYKPYQDGFEKVYHFKGFFRYISFKLTVSKISVQDGTIAKAYEDGKIIPQSDQESTN